MLYAVALFLALACLLRWQYLRQKGPHRVRRGLKQYVDTAGRPVPYGLADME
jgi:hypothetical protein